ncbi:hypothetical protein DLM45_13545 [Hyphomicrobium methylovorum]|uniref:glycosyltransferase family 2 protein n=1 Tax=Hyphomicrobium methylovorum TaxID=84 RepID=UPI0015E6AD95|nr:glycosyltransferase [Hyphomicrobium methylovorum]MBA2127239.1 hypothetical protein [Hyphomicrobium methylovorum]
MPTSISTTADLAICICTYKRPRLLATCLASLETQKLPKDLSVVIIVIDNDRDRTAAQVVAEVAHRAPMPVEYVVEERRGIAAARNRAIAAARARGAKWLAFIDDDETADPNWVAGLMHSDYADVPVLMGWQILQPPETVPFWYVADADSKKPNEGQACTAAYTNNVRFSMALPAAGLKFDENLGLGGGEDSQFFFNAHKQGFAIRHTARAITYETIHPERLTYARQLHRSYWIASANFRKDVTKFGWPYATLRRLHTIPLHLLVGTLLVVVSPAGIIFGLKSFKQLALLGGDKLGRGLGRLVAMFGHVPQPYAVIDGG